RASPSSIHRTAGTDLPHRATGRTSTPRWRKHIAHERTETMTRTLIAASAALFALTGLAAAQQSPELHGSYSANVINAYNGTVTSGVDFSGAAAIQAPTSEDAGKPSYSILSNENYSR